MENFINIMINYFSNFFILKSYIDASFISYLFYYSKWQINNDPGVNYKLQLKMSQQL